VLEVRGLGKGFGAEPVLDGVALVLPPGRAVAVVGPNGAGKTTFLRCVLGIEPPDSGEVLLDGRSLAERDPRVRAAVAASVDELAAFGDLSAAEHLELLACAHGVPGPAAAAAAVLDEVGLAGARDQLPVTLSSGQRRRLALAACLVRPRRLLVLDEPEQRLDGAGRAWLAERLRAEARSGGAVLFASHDEHLVDRVAGEVLRLGA
jgi:ABC-2 type transport system ATP-binding protein